MLIPLLLRTYNTYYIHSFNIYVVNSDNRSFLAIRTSLHHFVWHVVSSPPGEVWHAHNAKKDGWKKNMSSATAHHGAPRNVRKIQGVTGVISLLFEMELFYDFKPSFPTDRGQKTALNFRNGNIRWSGGWNIEGCESRILFAQIAGDSPEPPAFQTPIFFGTVQAKWPEFLSGGGNSNMFFWCSPTYLGKIPNLDYYIFQRGWNHQLDSIFGS